MAVRSTLPSHSPAEIREILRGLPTATGYTVTVKPLRYRTAPHLQAFTWWDHPEIVLATSPVRRFSDLDGKPVAAGAAGSGTRFTTDRLLAVAGIAPRLVTATQDGGADALAAGTVAGMLTLTGVPTPAVTRLARAVPLRMIPLDGYVDPMVGRYGEVYLMDWGLAKVREEAGKSPRSRSEPKPPAGPGPPCSKAA